MFRFPIAAVVGLTATLSAAHADTIIYQGTPTHDPLVISRGDISVLPGLSHSILHDPAFHRLAAMCDTLGLACGPDQLTPLGGIDPAWTHPLTPGHRADAEKRLARMIEESETYAEALTEHFETLPAPRPRAVPRLHFGWNAPFGVPYGTPRPFNFDDLFPPLGNPAGPHITLPRPVLPMAHDLLGAHDLSGFQHRLNTPAVIPHGILPRHTFPWRTF